MYADIKDGIPAGTYEMIPRNIVPGGAIAGLPNVFETWKLSGCWFYELKDGAWIRIEGGGDGTIASATL